MQVRPTGLTRRSPETTAKFLGSRMYSRRASPPSTVIQPVVFVRNQENKGSCVGQAVNACIDAVAGGVYGSAVDTWIDARRREGNLAAPNGTRSEFAIESIMERGVSPFDTSQDVQDPSLDVQLPALDSELAAYDRRVQVTDHMVVPVPRRDDIISALHASYGVVFGAGVTDCYFNPPNNTVLDSTYIGVDYNGHEQRIFAYFADLDAFGVQNSWGADWCWFTYGGRTFHGCTLVNPTAIDLAWDVDVLNIHTL